MNIAELSSDELKLLDKTCVWHHLTPGAVAERGVTLYVRGEGMSIWDIDGKRYLDASAGGVWVTNVGYGRTEIAQSVAEQLIQLNFFAGSSASAPSALFAEKLLKKMPNMSRVYYANSGSEANEKAFKMVRQISHKQYGGAKHKIIYRNRDYHGSTLGALSACGQPQRCAQFGPFVPGFIETDHCLEYRNPYGETDHFGIRAAQALEQTILREGPETVGALILEAITSGGGIITPPDGYWETIKDICKRYEILLIMDEVVCGLGRTGKWFGYQHYDIEPDIVVLAKGLASGYAAISCTVTTSKIYTLLQEDKNDALGYFRDISTYAGCLAGPVAALKNLEIMEREQLVENSAQQGEKLMVGLAVLKAKHEIIGDVRGKGLLCGIELVSDRQTKTPLPDHLVISVVEKCKSLGLLLGRTNQALEHNNILFICPPLIITADQVDEILVTIDKALSLFEKQQLNL